ncbi:hypothetical protein C8N35_110130 [Breoghania corrubedonensis]|uniref:DUF465 domain-containing protein n=1 Tax=Breoghania corrubedonensis TaxID=665038 RepID=A0A2T5V1K8_9HYPH|nr:DUF465 domain-containing protein [Breoghania corrubedonensis]PTW57651.1 hypothetical protein C8N35_110130 [Breoghania corrubedonensis]
MTHVPHELQEEFPEAAQVLHQLKMSDPRLESLCERYGTVNHDIHLIESEITPASDAATEDLKKERLALKDDIAEVLRKAGAIG